MTAINEKFLYGLIQLETAAWSTPFTWVDRTADLAAGFNYSEGGRLGPPGSSQTDVGTLNATFRNGSTFPAVGDLVRLRRYGTTEYAFTGYVQDVSQQIVFSNRTKLSTPVTLTTINCLDWVGYASQLPAIGAGGLSSAFARQDYYPYQSRARSLNNAIDNTNGTQLISFDSTSATSIIGDTDVVATVTEHLDLAAATQNLYWFGTHTLPTNKTTGRTGLVDIRPLTTAPSSGKTFTDLAGSAGQLHYTEIDLQSSSNNVANTIVLNNYSRITSTDSEVTKKGGGNKPNYGVVNNVEVVSVDFEGTWSTTDATSVTNYGNRATTIDTNLAGIVEDLNLVGNPSLEYGDDGWSTGANRMARRRPLDNGVSFAAVNGEWALRYRLASGGAATPSFRYSGSENDGIPIIVGTSYAFQASGARGAGTNTDSRVRAYIEWQDSSGAVLSTIRGAQFTVPTAYVWVAATVAGVAPANAERAIVGLEFNRSGGGTFSAGDQTWLDAAIMRKSASTAVQPYFDGDTDGTTSSLYLWTGELGLSPSFKVTNNLDDIIALYLARYSTTSNRVTRIRWNAQEDLTSVASLRVGYTTSIIYNGTTTTYRIVGIDGSVDPQRYMIDYYMEKV